MKPLYRFCKIALPPIFGVFAPTKAIGKKRKYFAKKLPLILVGNHLANVDTVVCGIKHKGQVYYLGKKELMQNKLVAACLNGLGIIPVDRGQADLSAMRTVLNHLKAGDTIAIYPEGTRNKVDSRLCKVYGGAAMFALKTKTSIVPFAFNLPARFMHKNYMLFGDPFELSDFYNERVNSETLEKADEIVKQELIKTKRLVDYIASIKGKTKRNLIRRLNDPTVPFARIYAECESNLLPYDQSVAPDDFDQTQKRSKKKKTK